MGKKIKLVRDQIVSSSILACIGEAPGREEVELGGIPFVGQAGAFLNRLLFLAGLRRSEVSVMNVVLRRPVDNKIESIPKDELEFWREDLQRRLCLLPNLRIVAPLGNTALEAVLGTDRVRISKNKKLTIGKARGFYFDDVTLANGRKVLVLPIFHPAATFREPKLTKGCEDLWRRLGEEIRHGLVADVNTLGPLLDDTFKIEPLPHPDDAIEFAEQIISEGRPVSFDIETPRETPRDKILMCSYTNDGVNGMTIPCDDFRACGPKEWRLKYLAAHKMILESDLEKIGQNDLFDCFEWKFVKGILVKNHVFDTRTMDLCLDPRREHDLSSIASSLFRMRYWKDKDEDARAADSYKDQSIYCSLDSLATWHAAMELRRRLEAANLWDVYLKIYRRRFYPLLRMMLHGTLIDQPERDRRYNELDIECSKIRDQIAEIAGVSLAGDKSLSDQKISQFIHGPRNPPQRPIKLTPKKGLPAKKQPPPWPKGLELDPIIDKDTKRPTVNEVALRRHRLRVEGKNKRAAQALDLILDHREKHQLMTFLSEDRVDEDNRFRTSFGFAETGRLTASESPYGRGGNSQNAHGKSKSIFLPDPGCIFLCADMSQIEDRIAKVYSGDPDLIRLAMLKPWEYDAHTDLASKIYGIPKEQVDKDQRFMGKKTRHAAERDVKGQRFSDELLKAGVVKSKADCERILEAFHVAEPGIRQGYFPFVRNEVMMRECLTSPWGFRAIFRSERKDDALMREAYSFLLQAGAVFTLDLQGLIPLDWAIEHGMFPNTHINNEIHDALVISSPPSEAYDVAEFLIANLEEPVTYNGVALSCPAGVKIGATLAEEDSYEWKKFPSRDEFMREAERLFELAEHKRKEAATWGQILKEREAAKRKATREMERAAKAEAAKSSKSPTAATETADAV